MQTWAARPGTFELTHAVRVVVRSPDPEAADVAALIAPELAALTGCEVSMAAATGELVLDLVPGRSDLPPEGYHLEIGDHVTVRASGRSGLLYGCQSVLQLLRSDPHRRRLPRGAGTDWPLFRERGQMIDVGRKYLPLAYLRSEIRRMAWLKLNSLQLHLTEWNGFRFESLAFPGLASPEHYTQQELRELDMYAARWGVRIVPEIDLPGHAVWVTRYDPRLRLRSPEMDRTGWPGGAGGGWTLDITSDFARDFVRTLLVELAGVFSGEFVHIGGDEVPVQDRAHQSRPLVRYAHAHGMRYAGDVLVDYLNDLAATLREHGKRAEIWEGWARDGQLTSIEPSKDIRVAKWLDGDPATWARQGYETVGVNWGRNFVTPGYGTMPGSTSPQGFDGYMPAEQVYEANDYPREERVLGYRLGRWMDKSESRSTEWVHFFSHRPLQVVAERTWGGPGSATAAAFYERADAIGSADEDLTAVPGSACRIVSVSSEETKAENGSAHHVLNPNPQTTWVTHYSGDLELTPHHVTIDLGEERHLAGLALWPRQDGAVVEEFHHTRARAKCVRVELSVDQRAWEFAWSGVLANAQPATTVRFAPSFARYLRVVVESDWDNLFVVALAYLSPLETRWDRSGV
jgi:hexosaminidase